MIGIEKKKKKKERKRKEQENLNQSSKEIWCWRGLVRERKSGVKKWKKGVVTSIQKLVLFQLHFSTEADRCLLNVSKKRNESKSSFFLYFLPWCSLNTEANHNPPNKHTIQVSKAQMINF